MLDDFEAGIAIAALALSPDTGAPDVPVESGLAQPLAGAIAAARATIDSGEARLENLERLVRRAVPPPLRALPSIPRVAALLAPLADVRARARAGPLPEPRRGYRPPNGLPQYLARRCRWCAMPSEERSTRARTEVERATSRPWPA